MRNNMRDFINKRKYAIIILSLLIIIISFISPFIILPYRKQIQISSKTIICEAAASQLNKDSSQFTKDDFSKITELDLSFSTLSDIKYLKNFTNLKKLNLSGIRTPDTRKPKWKQMLSKIGIIDISKEESVDLSPLKKLANLEILSLDFDARVRNIGALSALNNLKELSFKYSHNFTDLRPVGRILSLNRLNLYETDVSDLEPLKNLKNLQSLVLLATNVSNLEPLKSVTNLETLSLDSVDVYKLELIGTLTKLKSLSIFYATVSDLEPIKYLANLEYLHLYDANITDLEPIKKLPNLQTLRIEVCRNIKKEQIIDLKKALPKLIIYSDFSGVTP